MLRILPTNNKELIESLSISIFNRGPVRGIGYIFFNGEKPIGIAELDVTESAGEILSVGIIAEERKKGFGNFFTRSLLNTLSDIAPTVITYKSSYFKEFGFAENDDKMFIKSENIIFPRECEK